MRLLYFFKKVEIKKIPATIKKSVRRIRQCWEATWEPSWWRKHGAVFHDCPFSCFCP